MRSDQDIAFYGVIPESSGYVVLGVRKSTGYIRTELFLFIFGIVFVGKRVKESPLVRLCNFGNVFKITKQKFSASVTSQRLGLRHKNGVTRQSEELTDGGTDTLTNGGAGEPTGSRLIG